MSVSEGETGSMHYVPATEENKNTAVKTSWSHNWWQLVWSGSSTCTHRWGHCREMWLMSRFSQTHTYTHLGTHKQNTHRIQNIQGTTTDASAVNLLERSRSTRDMREYWRPTFHRPTRSLSESLSLLRRGLRLGIVHTLHRQSRHEHRTRYWGIC